MHISYAAEAYVAADAPKHSPRDTDQRIVERFAAEKEFLALADAIGDAKTSSIVATIRKNAGNKYAKVTPAQKYAVAAALLLKHGTALAVYAAAFNASEADFLATAE